MRQARHEQNRRIAAEISDESPLIWQLPLHRRIKAGVEFILAEMHEGMGNNTDNPYRDRTINTIAGASRVGETYDRFVERLNRPSLPRRVLGAVVGSKSR